MLGIWIELLYRQPLRFRDFIMLGIWVELLFRQLLGILPVHSWCFGLMGGPWSFLKSLDSFFSVTYLFGIVFLVTCVVFFP